MRNCRLSLFQLLVTFSVMIFLTVLCKDMLLWNRKIKQNGNIAESRSAVPEITSKIRIYRRNLSHWLHDNKICENLPIFRKAILKTTAGNTPIFVHDTEHDKDLSGSIIQSGQWDKPNTDFICKLLQRDPDILFVDLGANIGTFSLTAAKCGKRVLSVEPLYKNVQRFCASIIAGNLCNSITILFAAVSDVRENVTLAIDSENRGGTRVLKKSQSASNKNQYKGEIMTAKLDDLLNVPSISFSKVFLKIDVEGYESKALEGGKTFFDRVEIQGILMEWGITGHTGKEIVKFLVKRNFSPYYPDMSEKLPLNGTKKWPWNVLWKHDNVTL